MEKGIFIIDKDANNLLQPLNKSLENENVLNYQDANGYKFALKIVETINKKSESFDSYNWYKANNKTKSYKKISFYKYFEPFEFVIGTGEYFDDFEEELKKRVLSKINNIKYVNNGYIFIFVSKGNCLAHHNKEFIGTNRINYKDSNGKYLIKEIIDISKSKGSSFLSYNSSTKPNKKFRDSSKISYVKYLKDWDWSIGTGFYLSELKDELDKRKEYLEKSKDKSIKDITLISFALTLVFILISFIVSRYIKEKFLIYKKILKEETKKSFEREKILIQQSKMAAMGEMISNIAHQWRQPLSTISTAATGIKFQKEMDMLNDKDFYDGMDAINNSVQHLSKTIDDFRNFFSPNKKEEEFNVNQLIDKTLNIINAQFASKDIKIIKDIEEVHTFGLENEILQVLVNILNNAKDELVKKDTKDKIIIIDSFSRDENLYITIQDNAGGIKEDIIHRIFEPYFTTKFKSDGTGIGLYMSKIIIEKHMSEDLYVKNVEFEYNNTLQNGAKFIIKIQIIQLEIIRL